VALLDYLQGPGVLALAEFLAARRWFARGDHPIRRLTVTDWAVLRRDPLLLLMLVEVDGERYYLPLAARPVGGEPAPDATLARVAGRVVFDAHWDPDFGAELVQAMAARRTVRAQRGRFVCASLPDGIPGLAPPHRPLRGRPLGLEQSNTSVVVGEELLLKSYRRPHPGVNPDFEVAHFLATRTSFTDTPALRGWMEYREPSRAGATIAVLQPFVRNRGDGWEHGLAHLARLADAVGTVPPPGRPQAEDRIRILARDFLQEARELGAVTGRLHAALASDDRLPAFRPEPITLEDTRRWARGIVSNAAQVLAALRARAAGLPGPAQAAAAALLAMGAELERRVERLAVLADGKTRKIRCHGDYHLGQVLKTEAGWMVIDFEGEPARPAAKRRAKHAALRDVAGMLRSFNYAVHHCLAGRPESGREGLAAWLEVWEHLVSEAFLGGYLVAVAASAHPLVPAAPEALRQACTVFQLEKAVYELGYELAHRPEWVSIPAGGILAVVQTGSAPYE
jgi:maltose alpha-D-glucosyltransferase/alpha-amylase